VTIEALDSALGGSERALLDTSTLIAFQNPGERAHHLATHLLGRIQRDEDSLRGFYSVVSASEILIRPLRTGPDRVAFVHSFITSFPNLTLLPVDLSVSMLAAAIRSGFGLRLPDALVVASGLLAGVEAIVSNDARWRRLQPSFREFRWIYLGDFV
jgi:predicted nucleic acid-binding protein